tara:strand:+ start:183 stop:851 length:669 start_codon:yes stop_codon:yes gene_type:complete
MVSIDAVYQKVLAFANKEQRGYITPQEFNLYADQAQKEIFEQYFYDLNQFLRTSSNSDEYSDIIDNLQEKISIFETSVDVTNRLPIDLFRLGSIIYDGREVEQVQLSELTALNASYLTRPTNRRRVYIREGDVIEVFPGITGEITINYVQIPKQPRWGYFVVGGKALHDVSLDKTTNFKLHPSEETELVYKILKYAGISMKRDDLASGGQNLELSQVQQEKQ